MAIIVLVWVILLTLVGTCAALVLTVRTLWQRLQAFEQRLSERPQASLPAPEPRPLAGLRVALDVRQDHPNAPFVVLLKERLLREDVILEPGGLTISGSLVGNGYADVYYRADLAVLADGQPLFALNERPPHGDRPENLALELVERLKIEWAKRERQSALRELHERE